ncbi:hypothetical protein F5Y01DRAFT_34801 [Xylaria sp. FL0043]|nr:hypothetical protein F5Y01DRAFT_34801 [Xylaria sp. FL0043]
MANILNPHPNINIVELLNGANALDVDQNNWGTLDFTTGRVDYTDDVHPGIVTEQNTPREIIGTAGLASCTGVVILTQTRAVVAHYSTGFVGDDFVQYLVNNRAQLRNGRAWIMHCYDEIPVNPGADTDDDDLGRQLYATLRDDLRMSLENIVVLKYKPPQDPIPPNDPWGNQGEGSIMVDGRNSPAQMATVYAQGYQQL